MTKEIDLLSIGKTDNSSNINSDTKTSKKEGLSLFDSLLMKSKDDIKAQTPETDQQSTSNQSFDEVVDEKSPKESEKNTSENLEKNIKENSKELKATVKNETLETSKVEKNEINKETTKSFNQNSSLTETSEDIITKATEEAENINKTSKNMGSSILDRMVIETKKNIKSNNIKEELKQQNINTTENKTEDILSSKSDSISKNSDLNLIENDETDSLKNKEIKNNKIVNENISEDSEILDKNTKSNETDNSDIKSETSNKTTIDVDKEESSSVAKIVSKETTVTDTKGINVEQKVDENLAKEDNKDIKREKSSSSMNIQNDTKIEMPKEESSVNDIEIKAKSFEKQEINEKPRSNSSSENKIEKKDNTSDFIKEETNKITKNEQVQAVMDFDDKAKDITQTNELEKKGTFDKVEVENRDISTNRDLESITKEENSNKNLKNINIKNENNPLINTEVKVKETSEETTEIKEIVKDTKETLSSEIKPKIKEKDTTTSEINTQKQTNKVIDKPETKNILNEDITKKSESSQTIKTEELTNSSKIQSDVNSTNKDFSKIDKEALVNNEERVTVSKEDINRLQENISKDESLKNEKQSAKSLMDRLFDNAKEQRFSTKSSKNDNLSTQANQNVDDVATNIFLSSQKNSIYNQMIVNKSEGVKLVKNANSVSDVKKGAEILDLDLKDISVEVDEVVKKEQTSNQNKITVLDKLAFDRKMNLEESINKTITNNLNTTSSSTTTEVSSNVTTATTNTLITETNLNVNTTLAMNIQNRIIGARQHMNSMMSDVAKNMYENYKPPVTAFRINLFPAQLGHIAILMKNDKENSLSISMNMSQSSTMDTFVENQSVLKDALNRVFNNTQTNFNLDFSMQDGNSNGSSSNEQNGNNQNNQTYSSDEIIESIVQNKDLAEDLNYM